MGIRISSLISFRVDVYEAYMTFILNKGNVGCRSAIEKILVQTNFSSDMNFHHRFHRNQSVTIIIHVLLIYKRNVLFFLQQPSAEDGIL